jgi:hypothetical protein
VRAFFATFGLSLVLVAAFNWRVDPLGHRSQTPQAVELPQGFMYPARAINDRVLKMRLLDRAARGQVIVLGSSRSLAWGTPDVPERAPVLNLAVTNGDAVDYLGLLRHINEIDAQPAAIYVEVSPWTLCPRRGSDPARRFLENEPSRYTFDELVSISVLRQSVIGLWHDDLPGRLIATSNLERYGYLADGRFRYPESYLSTPVAESSRLAQGWATDDRSAFLRCVPDAPTVAALCDALAAAQKRGARVELLTLPWNPAALRVGSQGDEPSPIERAHDALAAALEARWPKPVHRLERVCAEVDFFDAYHPRGSCFAQVARRLAE